jgi:prophage tail gpP-like protein
VADRFTWQIPQKFLDDPETAEWCRAITLQLDNLTREDGVIETGELVGEVVLTQQEKLDLIGITQTVDLDDVEAKIDKIATGEPTYVVFNGSTSRVLNANSGDAAISATYVAAEIEGIRDALLKLQDVVGTLLPDLATKDILG